MSDTGSQFAAALQDFDRSVLNEAFDACNHLADVTPYDRTALNRWLDGSLPGRGEFVVKLAEQLGAPALLEAWRADQSGPSSTEAKSILTRFRGLPQPEKDRVFRELRQEMARTSPIVRANFSMHIDLRDSDHSADTYDLSVAINWDGYLPAAAKTVIVNEYRKLTAAFRESDCIFRDVVQLDDDLLRTALSADGTSQTLSYRPLDRIGDLTVLEATSDGDGTFRFDNDEIEQARVKLRVSYPFPRGAPLYPIVFRGYMIRGLARITLVTHAKRATRPQGYAFLGAGQSWQTSPLPNEVEIEAGGSDALLGEETGIVLQWNELS